MSNNYRPEDAFSRANIGSISASAPVSNLFDPSRNFIYSEELRNAAENYMIKCFEIGPVSNGGGVGLVSFDHTIMCMNIAMHIVSNNNWVQHVPQDVTMNIIENGQDEVDFNDDDEGPENK